ncbi:MAG: hypothetical protein WCI67_10655 [Chloroflexales bacterium]
MDSPLRAQNAHRYASDPLEQYWIIAVLPDVLYAPPPDAVGQAGERPEDTFLVTSVIVMVAMLVALIALTALVF